MLPIILKAARIVGNGRTNVSALARAIDAPRPACYAWKQVPARFVFAIERATGGRIKPYQMRPDLYPPSRYKDADASA